jgi:hypothetical protein
VRATTYQYFDVDGSAEVVVPAGRVVVTVTRGPEYRPVRRELSLDAGTTDTVPVTLDRLADLPALGWWSGDLHVHMNYGGSYRNTPAHLVFQARAEDLHVVENLIVNKEQRIPDIAYFRPGRDPASTPAYQLFHAQEFHTGFWDHAGVLNLQEHLLLPDYAGYANTPLASIYPPNAVVADLAHAQGGLLGYVHPYDSRPNPFDTTAGLSSELPVDVALGKVDYLEVLGFSNHLITSEVWYRLLNCGFRVPAGAGSDAFPNFAMLRGPVGLARVYVKSGPVLDHDRFLAGLRQGRTFVTNGPLLTFTVGGQEPGEEIRLAAPARVAARVTLRSNVPVDHLEIIGNGQVVASHHGGHHRAGPGAAQRLAGAACLRRRPARAGARPVPVRLDEPGLCHRGWSADSVPCRRGILRALDRSCDGRDSGAHGVEWRDGKGPRAGAARGRTGRVRGTGEGG